MRSELERLAWIDDYLDGNLNAKEKAEFEKQLQIDPELGSDLEAQKMANELVFDYKLLDIKSQLNDIHLQAKKKKATQKRNLWGGIGAAILITVLSFTAYKMSSSENTPVLSQQDTSPSNDEVLKEKVVSTTESPVLVIPSKKELNQLKKSKDKNTVIKNDEKIAEVNKVDESINNTDVVEEETPTDSNLNPNINNEDKLDPKLDHRNPDVSNDNIKKKDEGVDDDNSTDESTVDNSSSEDDNEVEDGYTPLNVSKAMLDVFSCKKPTLFNTNGVIVLDEYTITGGEQPYEYSLNNEEFQDNAEFENLARGEYKIYVKDARGNIGIVNIQLKEEPIEINYMMNDTWELPSCGGCTFKVYNKMGRVVFQSTPGLQEWDGLANGQQLERGVYTVRMTINGALKQGEITIVN